MYVLAPKQSVEEFPYSTSELRKSHPQTSFPQNPTDELLASYGVFPVEQTSAPQVTSTQVAEQIGCIQNGEVWETAWVVRSKTADELAAEAAKRARLRQAAYQTEADPLFFKAQRGESTMEAWLAKVAEIKTRFPE